MSPAPSIDYLAAWAAELNARRGRGSAAKTVKGHDDALRSFWAFVIRRDYATRNAMLKMDTPVCDQRPNDYLRPAEDSALLCTRPGTPFGATHLERVVMRVAARAGVRAHMAKDKGGWHVSDVTPHTLRRTFGSSLIIAGTLLHVVSHLLGHSNTTVTERAYAQLEAQTAAAGVLRYVA